MDPEAFGSLRRMCEGFGRFRLYSEEGLNNGIGDGLPQRFDVAANFLRTGGRLGRMDLPHRMASRTACFRETLAWAGDPLCAGVEPLLHYAPFIENARKVHGLPIVVPSIVFANLMLPGQELGVHIDVPEFLGATRVEYPEWLMVVMHYSGLFRPWRVRIAQAVTFLHTPGGASGAHYYYPDGPKEAPVVVPVRANISLIGDFDSLVHGVDLIEGEVPDLTPGAELRFDSDGSWRLCSRDETIARYRWEELRMALLWRGRCFADDAEEASWRAGEGALSLDFILDRLVEELRRRGVLRAAVPGRRELARMLVETFVEFP